MQSPTHIRSPILWLPTELRFRILCELKPRDLVAFCSTCRVARAHIIDQLLWRSAHLLVFDDPFITWSSLTPTARAMNAHRESSWDWFLSTRSRYTLLNALKKGERTEKSLSVNLYADVLLGLVETANAEAPETGNPAWPSNGGSANIALLADLVDKHRRGVEAQAIHDYLSHSDYPSEANDTLGEWPVRPITRSMTRLIYPTDAASRLHLLYGLTHREAHSRFARCEARQLVYDWSSVSEATDFGPFRPDGNINWQLLEAVGSLMGHNLPRLALRDRDRTTFPRGLRYVLPHRIPIDPALPGDWAGITGSWLGTYGFLDYRQLHFYNMDRAHRRAELEEFEEEVGQLMELELKLSEDLASDRKLTFGLPICKDLPILYFEGQSKMRRAMPTQYPQALIGVRGCVALVPDGKTVRWMFIIRYILDDATTAPFILR